MASNIAAIDPEALDSFHQHLLKSRRIMALCGAGLSAASGLPTFRGPGGLWRTHQSTDLATPSAWRADPGLVWQFYGYRRHMSLNVKPNAAHYALAELARRNPNFQCLSQNVDGLHQRVGHPQENLQLLHGTLFKVKCDRIGPCDYVREDFTDPFCPALAMPLDGSDPTADTTRQALRELDISDPTVNITSIPKTELPKCPQCKSGTLRPAVVWFGEALPSNVIDFADEWISEAAVDLILVIGTSARVYPAVGYVGKARSKDTRVAIINMDPNDTPAGGTRPGDWMFQGDASKIIPELLKPIVGEITVPA